MCTFWQSFWDRVPNAKNRAYPRVDPPAESFAGISSTGIHPCFVPKAMPTQPRVSETAPMNRGFPHCFFASTYQRIPSPGRRFQSKIRAKRLHASPSMVSKSIPIRVPCKSTPASASTASSTVTSFNLHFSSSSTNSRFSSSSTNCHFS